MHEDLKDLIGNQVVVDTAGPMLYIGTLKEIGRHVMVFGEVDVHDTRDARSTTTREVYIMESRKHGLQANLHVSVCRGQEQRYPEAFDVQLQDSAFQLAQPSGRFGIQRQDAVDGGLQRGGQQLW